MNELQDNTLQEELLMAHANSVCAAVHDQEIREFNPLRPVRLPADAATLKAQDELEQCWRDWLRQPGSERARAHEVMTKVLELVDVRRSMWDDWAAAGGQWHVGSKTPLLVACVQQQDRSTAWDHRPDSLRWLLEHQAPIDPIHGHTPKRIFFKLLARGILWPGVWDAWRAHPQCPPPNTSRAPVRWTDADGLHYPCHARTNDTSVTAFLNGSSLWRLTQEELRHAFRALADWDPAAWSAYCAEAPVSDAVRRNLTNLLQFHLAEGGDPEASRHEGLPPLHEAVTRLNVATVHLLLAHGADANGQDDEGALPLHHLLYLPNARELKSRDGISKTSSALENRLAIAALLHEAGANLHAPVPASWADEGLPWPQFKQKDMVPVDWLSYVAWRFADEPLGAYAASLVSTEVLTAKLNEAPTRAFTSGTEGSERRPRL